jgi:hypothetical protein
MRTTRTKTTDPAAVTDETQAAAYVAQLTREQRDLIRRALLDVRDAEACAAFVAHVRTVLAGMLTADPDVHDGHGDPISLVFEANDYDDEFFYDSTGPIAMYADGHAAKFDLDADFDADGVLLTAAGARYPIGPQTVLVLHLPTGDAAAAIDTMRIPGVHTPDLVAAHIRQWSEHPSALNQTADQN